MSRYNKDLGDFGEKVSSEYLRDEGYKIICEKYNTNSGEIDIIAENEKYLIFVEVKTRSSLKFGYPAEAVNYNKMKHIISAAERYVFDNPTQKEIRFDVIEVIARISNDKPRLIEVNHIPDIVLGDA
ncbi:MAG: YraN family protein [Clostridia bacterium]|nr:YraN family protein [Clostridia bacterium]